MKRKLRIEKLEVLEEILKTSKKSLGEIIQTLIKSGYSKKKIKNIAKTLHPQDYKNRYPLSAEFFRRVCYNSNHWGNDVRKIGGILKKYRKCLEKENREYILLKQIQIVSSRPGELKKRFIGLLKYCGDNENCVQELLNKVEENIKNIEDLKYLKERLEKERPRFIYFHDSVLYTLNSLILLEEIKKEA